MLNFSPKSLSLGWYSEDEIVKISAVEVTIPASFDAFGHPHPDGLYDPRMGPLQDASCQTCGLDSLTCPGHFGHYRLSRPVLNPLTFDTAYALLKASCGSCQHFKVTAAERLVVYTRIKAMKMGVEIGNAEAFVAGKGAETIEAELSALRAQKCGRERTLQFEQVGQFIRKTSAKTSCPRCNFKGPKLTKAGGIRILRLGENGMMDYVTPQAVQTQLERLFENERALVSEMFERVGTEMFILKVLAIAPNRFRPASFIANRVVESPLNVHLSRIIHASVLTESDENGWPELQTQVLLYFDSSKAPSITYAGHKQILEKKEGLFRKNIMGKRVNYAARSVISPDPNIEARDVGVPVVFASQLTFPERVTSFNYERLRRMVINGAAYPGANFVQIDGALVNLRFISQERRLAIASRLLEGSRVVWRHLLDGDPLLVNRQPTLHSTSLMAHHAKVLRNEKTLRIHYVNCKSYNADFDGDEMNIHFPQDFISLAELNTLALNDNSYIVPSTGEPIRGLVQDHIIAAVFLTMKDSFFTREDLISMVDCGVRNLKNTPILLQSRFLSIPPPCIVSPIPLYSGKQVISCVMQNFGLRINFSVKSKMKFQGEEGELRLFRGEVVTGVLDKASVGASSYSLIHACGEMYGYQICNDLITAISRVVNRYMAIRGFTVRFDDLMLDRETDRERAAVFQAASEAAEEFQMGEQVVLGLRSASAAAGPASVRDAAKVEVLDKKMRVFMNDISSKVMPFLETGMFKKFPSNNMVDIIMSGSKGSMVNLSQISLSLGQQELEGRRVPYMASGKTLPCFTALEASPAAGGFVFERFTTGINPATFFFHCMAGREGLIDTTVKTANSGYLQRCLAKHLEGVAVTNDLKVMNGQRIIQFKFGDDGLDVKRCSYLDRHDFYESNLGSSHGSHVSSGTSSNSNPDTSSDKAGERTRNTTVPGDVVPEYYKDKIKHLSPDLRNHMLSKYISSMANPGHGVGIIAAQSIGEPSTQMTLNTFHLAGVGGVNVTLGIPRLREILTTASKAIKTPIISVPAADAEEIVGLFRKTSLEDCIEKVTVGERIAIRDGEYKKLIKITFDLCGDIDLAVKAIDVGFFRQLGRELRKRTSSTGITEQNETTERTRDGADEESSSSSSTADGNPDFTCETSEFVETETNADNGSAETNADNESEFLENIDENAKEEEEPAVNLLNLRRITSSRYAFEIFYPSDFNILLMPIIESIIRKTVVRQVKGFNKATSNGTLVYFEGSDFISLAGLIDGVDLMEKIDFYSSESNDIYAVYRTFGVEAARETIVRQIVSVFDAYGIKINIRHLYLISDYMTSEGTFKPFNRHAFSMDDSFVQKMSFESCFANLKNSAIFNQTETIQGTSACILTGDALKSGTGAFELMYDLRQFAE